MNDADVPRVRDYLAHIDMAITRINRYLADHDKASFLASEEKQDAVIRNIEIIGEAAQSIRRRYPEFAACHPEIPWGGVYGMSNAEFAKLVPYGPATVVPPPSERLLLWPIKNSAMFSPGAIGWRG